MIEKKGSISNASIEARIEPYEVKEMEIEKGIKKPQAIESGFFSHVAYEENKQLVFLGTSDHSLHSFFMPMKSSKLKYHNSYKKLYHSSSSSCFLDSWGIYLTCIDGKISLYTLPLQSNPQVEGSKLSKTQTSGLIVLEETKNIIHFVASEEAKVLCTINKQQILQIFDWSVNRNLKFRTQIDLQATFSSSIGPVQKVLIMSENYVFLVGKKTWEVVHLDSGKVIEKKLNLEDPTIQLEIETTMSCFYLSVPTLDSKGFATRNDVLVATKHRLFCVTLVQTTLEKTIQLRPLHLTSTLSLDKSSCLLEYNQQPKALYYHHPFLLTVVQESNEETNLVVYNYGSMHQVQKIKLPPKFCSVICPPSSSSLGTIEFSTTLVLLSPTLVYEAQLKSISQLIRGNMKQKQYEDAVSLVTLCQQEEALVDPLERQEIFTKYACDLYEKSLYEQAMEYFYESKIEVIDLLKFFYPKELLPRGQSLQQVVSSSSTSRLSSSSSSSRRRRTTSQQQQTLFSIGTAPSVKCFLQESTRSSSSSTNKTLVQRLEALVGYLHKVRQHWRWSSHRHRHTTQEEEEEELDEEIVMERELVDTLLLKCLVLLLQDQSNSNSSTEAKEYGHELLQLVRDEKNWCEIGETEMFLRANQQFEALLFFYATRQLHRKALDLLEELERNEIQKKSKEYMEEMTNYLRCLDGISSSQLIFEYSKRILSLRPALGLTIFTQRLLGGGGRTNTRTTTTGSQYDLDPVMVLQHLKTCQVDCHKNSVNKEDDIPLTDGRFLAITYLFQLIMGNEGNGNHHSMTTMFSSKLHDELVYLLLDAILQHHQSSPMNNRLTSRVSSQRGLVGILRKKLILFLEFEHALYHPERMLSRTPNEMLEEKAILLSKLKRHVEVLGLYVLEMKDTQLAEAYCNKCYEQQQADASIYTSLLQLYLRSHPVREPSSASSPSAISPPICANWTTRTTSSVGETAMTAAVHILNKYADRIDVTKVMDFLPSDLPMHSLGIFFQRVLEHQVERFRTGQVKTQLAKMENFRIRQLFVRQKQQSVVIRPEDTCAICGQSFGSSTSITRSNTTTSTSHTTGSINSSNTRIVRVSHGALLHFTCHQAHVGSSSSSSSSFSTTFYGINSTSTTTTTSSSRLFL